MTDGEVLSDDNSATYSYYQSNIKPAPAKEEKKAGGVKYAVISTKERYFQRISSVRICKHGAADFEKI